MSYELSGMVVRNYMGKKYLSIPKDDFDVNIGEVDEEIVEEEKEMKGAVVVGVKYFESYDACYSCKRKVVAMGSVGVMWAVRDNAEDREVFDIHNCQD